MESYHSHLPDSQEARSTRLAARAHAAIPCPLGAGDGPVPHCGETITMASGISRSPCAVRRGSANFKATARRDASASCPNPHEGPDN